MSWETWCDRSLTGSHADPYFRIAPWPFRDDFCSSFDFTILSYRPGHCGTKESYHQMLYCWRLAPLFYYSGWVSPGWDSFFKWCVITWGLIKKIHSKRLQAHLHAKQPWKGKISKVNGLTIVSFQNLAFLGSGTATSFFHEERLTSHVTFCFM